MTFAASDTPIASVRGTRQELARQYLQWVRVLLPAAAGVALFVAAAVFDSGGILAAAFVAVGSGVLAVPLSLAARRFGYELMVRVSIYVDIVLIALFVTRFDDVHVYGVTFMWAIVVAAAFGTPRDTVAATVLSLCLTISLPSLTGNPDAAQVVVETLMLGVVGSMVTALNIDARRAAHERRSLARQLEDAQRLAQIGSFEFDPDTDVAHWSDQMFRIFQPRDGAPLGQPAFLSAIVAEDRAKVGQQLAHGLQSGAVVSFDTKIHRGDGEVRSVHVVGSPVYGDDGMRIVGTVQDVTELRQLDSMRDEFVAAASHELRTPTSIVLGFATTLTGEWERLPDVDRRRFVGEIEDAALRLSLLIEDVLQVSQIENGSVHCVNEPFDLRAEVVDLVRTWPGDTAVELDVDADGPTRAIGDPARTRQVMVNLLENAERHARDAAAPIRIRISRDGDTIAASVIDHGPGIPEDAHERIFDRFVRLGHDSTGTGLGLYISRRLAEAQGGSLDVDSRPGEGATFTFALPVDPGTDRA